MNARTPLSMLPVALLLSAMTCAQTQAFFNKHSYAGPASVRTIYTGDLNNDGIPDLIETSLQVADHFTVQIANADGSFQPAKNIAFPAPLPQGVNTAYVGDVNGDGKVDVVFAMGGQRVLNVYLGHGDGTFAPVKTDTIALPDTQHFGGMPLRGADFNHDGHVDLFTQANNDTVGALYLMNGDGAGNFGTPKALATIAAADNSAFSDYGAGDFDADGQADIAYGKGSCSPSHCDIFVHVLYGNGALGFTDVTSTFDSGDLVFNIADVDSDGRSDVVGSGLSGTFALLGQTTRTLVTKQVGPASPTQAIFQGNLVADFNGDTLMDVAGVQYNADTNDMRLILYLQNSAGLFNAESADAFAAGQFTAVPVVGDFDRDTRPDVLTIENGTDPSQFIIDEFLNTTSGLQWGGWGGCAYPSAAQGIHVCTPGSSTTSPVRFRAAANSLAPLRKLEVWIDGHKAVEQFHVWDVKGWLDYTTPLADGAHSITMYAVNPDSRFIKTRFTLNVSASGSCSNATTTGTTICSPQSGSTVSSPVRIQAAGGTSVKNMEAWVDGVKRYAGAGNTVSLSLALSNGTHKLTVFSKNGGTTLSSAVSTFTVGAGGGGCTPSSSTATVICSPVNGSTVSSPVNLQASGGSSVNVLEVWIDGVKKYTVQSRSFSITTSLSAGSHRMTAFGKNGSTVLSSAVSNFTVN